jgi:hypothetical protein
VAGETGFETGHDLDEVTGSEPRPAHLAALLLRGRVVGAMAEDGNLHPCSQQSFVDRGDASPWQPFARFVAKDLASA